MSRTPRIQWAQLFALPEHAALSLQARLRRAVVQAILDGHLPPGAPMPSSRELAQLLALGRNTVTAAYQQLIDEQFLEARPRRGVFVAAQARPPMAVGFAAPAREPGRAPHWDRRLRRSLAANRTLAKPSQWRRYPYPFVYGTFDPELFPTEDFRECCARSLARAQLPHWTPDFETDDVPELVEQIRLRLLPKRGVFALAEEILVTVGAQHSYHLLAEALFDADTRVGLEEPGHPHARNTFSLRQPRVVPIAVDDEGLVIDAMPPVDYVFVTPSHQSPTTATLSLDRRHWLLKRAELNDFVVIEDDYEAENLYAGSPMPALKSLDKSGRVIYIGSLSKSLSPALRLGYIVAPRGLIAELRLLRHAMVRHPSAFLQQAYALFLQLGHHESHARRVNAAMQERLAVLAQALRQHLPDCAFRVPQGGASVWVRAPAWVDATELALIAQRHGVLIEPGEVFHVQPPYPCPYFRLRLSSIAASQIPAGVRALGQALDDLAAARGERRAPGSRAH
ncbi:PLP-dependent aminotransferase family protein [Ideonella sp. A 288]|uniref:MocR-like pyridoxine biosynthesis transcription factor PdxR n=1 Tax=Ideonella sp. A 288 TaxID=1962181 RepID=UPI000B4A5BEC|nr:PLP-dependent aminotransferase family protein [Ideonella sp. A 288]